MTERPHWSDPVHLIAFGFGAGGSLVAPGTMGSVLAFPFWLLLRNLSPIVYLGLLDLLFALGVWARGTRSGSP